MAQSREAAHQGGHDVASSEVSIQHEVTGYLKRHILDTT